MEESIYKLRESDQLQLFTSNKEILYPKLKRIAESCPTIKEYPQQYIQLTQRLLNITEQLEKTLHQRRIKYRYILANGEEFNINDQIICSLLKIIWKYCEPLDSESAVKLYNELEDIELLLNRISFNL